MADGFKFLKAEVTNFAFSSFLICSQLSGLALTGRLNCAAHLKASLCHQAFPECETDTELNVCGRW